jgi:hypothetical protein
MDQVDMLEGIRVHRPLGADPDLEAIDGQIADQQRTNFISVTKIQPDFSRVFLCPNRDISNAPLIAGVELQADRIAIVFPDLDGQITDRIAKPLGRFASRPDQGFRFFLRESPRIFRQVQCRKGFPRTLENGALLVVPTRSPRPLQRVSDQIPSRRQIDDSIPTRVLIESFLNRARIVLVVIGNRTKIDDIENSRIVWKQDRPGSFLCPRDGSKGKGEEDGR